MTPRRLIAQSPNGATGVLARPPQTSTGMGISQAALCGGPRLYRLWKNSDFDFALKGRGFSRAVIAVKWRER
jgi:hypothetical protein